RRDHRAGAVPGRAAHRGNELRAADPLCRGGADLPGGKLGAVGAADPARKAAQPLWRLHRGGLMIALESIHKRFADLEVLRGISLVVPERSVTALIGPSGSGKSTLLRCVNLLEMPHSGSVTVGDARVRFA